MFLGFMALDVAFRLASLFKDGDVPTDSSTTTLYRIYGDEGLIASGTMSAAETGVVTAASNATPIVITSADHNLQTGQRVTIAGVGGNAAANGTWTITRINADTYSLDTSVGDGDYTVGGTWHTTGFYGVEITPTEATEYAAGEYYDVVTYATIGGNVIAKEYRFGVV
jgi:hypothetical protein